MDQISFFMNIGAKEPPMRRKDKDKKPAHSGRPAGQRKEIFCGKNGEGVPQGRAKRRG